MRGLVSNPGRTRGARYRGRAPIIEERKKLRTQRQKEHLRRQQNMKIIRRMHQPGIEPGSHRWQQCILPLDHWCCWVNFWNVTLLYRKSKGAALQWCFTGDLEDWSKTPCVAFWYWFPLANGMEFGAFGDFWTLAEDGPKTHRSSKFLGVRETASSRQTVSQIN